MKPKPSVEAQQKPLAGDCTHAWQNQKGRYLVEQICERCKLYRYKSNPTADWEYRVPIPLGRLATD